MSNLFRFLPAVDRLLETLLEDRELSVLPRTMLRDLTNEFLDRCRERIKNGEIADSRELALERLSGRLYDFVRRKSRPHFRRVLNGTGVVIHTNLGRSVLAEAACSAVEQACRHYSNLEF
ncbi:MAG: L-seryl-tRNA(Sec) selenium transferase, partial [Desulfonatronovibrionaceae bacterium]